MSDARQLLDALRLRARHRQRLPIDTVWSAFRASIRGYTGATEARPHLGGLLQQLAARGEVTLPRGKKLWDGSADPPLPSWVAVPRDAVPSAERVDHRSIPWPPELAFVASKPQVPLLEELLAIKRFLADGGRQRRLVPAKERSLELFNDEKRLDGLSSSTLFREGRLSLELLRCYPVAPPLVWAPNLEVQPGRPVLVLENLHTYESFRRWNLRAGAYRAVAYGHGSEFKATCRDLPRLCTELGTTLVHYFGDLDGQGLVIPVHARQVLDELEVPVRLLPAVRWYEALLARAGKAVATTSEQVVSEDVLAWLPIEQREAARAILAQGMRLPQELVGTDCLAALRPE